MIKISFNVRTHLRQQTYWVKIVLPLLLVVDSYCSNAQNARSNLIGSWIYSDGNGNKIRIIMGKNGSFTSTSQFSGRKGYYVRKGSYHLTKDKVAIVYPLRDFDLPFANIKYYVGTMVDSYDLKAGNLDYTGSNLFFKSSDGLQKGLMSRRIDKKVRFTKVSQEEGNLFMRLRPPNSALGDLKSKST